MRVLIVTQYFWPEHFRINDLAKGLVERGHEVHVLTGAPNYPNGRFFNGYGFFNGDETHDHIQIHRVPLIPRGTGSAPRLLLNYLSFALSACVLGPLFCRGTFQRIFVCQLSPVTVAIPGILLKWIKRAPLFMWVLDLWPESLAAAGGMRSRVLHSLVGRLVGFIYRRCDRILYASEGFRNSIKARVNTELGMCYLPNWVEDPVSEEVISVPDLPEGFRVLFAGNIGASQDFETVLGAAERLRTCPDIQWLIVGDGRQAEWLRSEIKARGLGASVHMFGRFPAGAMPAFFSSADAFLVTLKREPVFALTVPGKVQAYLAFGRPILAAMDGEGARLIKQADAGLAVPAGDSEGLAGAVMKLRNMSPEERAAMGARAKAYCAAHFDRNMLFDTLDQWLVEGRCTQS